MIVGVSRRVKDFKLKAGKSDLVLVIKALDAAEVGKVQVPRQSSKKKC